MPAPVNHAPEASGRIQSIDRAVELLEAVAAASEAETAPAPPDGCGLNRSTAWRLLATLEHHGLVDRDPATNRYRVGLALLKLAGSGGGRKAGGAGDPLRR